MCIEAVKKCGMTTCPGPQANACPPEQAQDGLKPIAFVPPVRRRNGAGGEQAAQAEPKTSRSESA